MMDDESDAKIAAEAALIQAAALLDDCGVDYVLYVRTSPETYGRRIAYKSAKRMVEGHWFVSIDLGKFVKDVAVIAAEECDRAGGPGT